MKVQGRSGGLGARSGCCLPRAQVDCVQEVELCREHQITGFPSIRVFRAGAPDLARCKNMLRTLAPC